MSIPTKGPMRGVIRVSAREYGPVIDSVTLKLSCGHTEEISITKGATYDPPEVIDCRACGENLTSFNP